MTRKLAARGVSLCECPDRLHSVWGTLRQAMSERVLATTQGQPIEIAPTRIRRKLRAFIRLREYH